MMFGPRTIYSKIAVIFYPLLAVAIGLFCYLLLRHSQYQITQDILQGANNTSQTIKFSLNHAMLKRDTEEALAILNSLRQRFDTKEILILDQQCQIALPGAQKRRLPKDPQKDPSCRICHHNSTQPVLKTIIYTHPNGTKVLRTVNPIENSPECHRCHNPQQQITGVIITDTSLAGLENRLASQLTWVLSLGGITFIIIVAGVELVFRRFIHHLISLLLNGAKELTAGNIYYQVPIETKDEISELAKTFNNMSLSLYESKVKLLDAIEEREHLHAELVTFHYLMHKISSTLEIEELTRIVVDYFADIIDSDSCYLALFPRSLVPTLTVRIKIKGKEEIRVYDIDLSGISASTKEKGSIFFWDRLIKEVIPELREGFPIDNGDYYSLKNFIKVKDKCIGLISLYKKGQQSFGLREKRLFNSLTQSLSQPIYNSILYEVATIDRLTGLYSRGFLEDFLESQIESHKRIQAPLSIILVDIDNFTDINKTYGHPTGDRLLCWLGLILKGSSRAMDIASRIGNDEFAILLPKADVRSAEEVAQRIILRIHTYPLQLEDLDTSIPITLSLGCASFPQDAGTGKELIFKADQALYRAKEAGGKRVLLASDI
jgi:diguanylate cyclase (GGDEF)-like protein